MKFLTFNIVFTSLYFGHFYYNNNNNNNNKRICIVPVCRSTSEALESSVWECQTHLGTKWTLSLAPTAAAARDQSCHLVYVSWAFLLFIDKVAKSSVT